MMRRVATEHAMAGYSGTPLPRKLGMKPGHRVAVVGAPKSAQATIAEVAASGPIELRLGTGPYDVIVLFCETQKILADRFGTARTRLAEHGGLWIAWPKKASGAPTDLGDAVVRNVGLASGLVDNKICAIDETWSGLRFVVRVKDRKATVPKTKRR